ncbi:hypothetical protein BKA58DRAFT_439913 [Alternaria rosae]|uniref:uncharacterized protein n=1 Tax=Alternaria rosae TaxID=1187941 RepID=UPI001E8DA42A|nr:uncharacterized protein BKA58DRAFT_439913 [Alternaria rosae]KAH6870365.1 hypothetical protein BKA58DRAFT_439913 [Alternaria rosae]
MSSIPPQKASHQTPAKPFGPLIATSFRSNGNLRQYYDYTPAVDASIQDHPFRIDATHATKRRNRNAVNEEMMQEGDDAREDGIATACGHRRSFDSLAEFPMSEDSQDGKDREGSDGSSHTVGRAESSSSTLAVDGDGGQEISEDGEDGSEGMEDSESDRGEGDESETSSRTVGRSEDSDSRDKDSDGDEEMNESDDEGDLFGESYREGSRK